MPFGISAGAATLIAGGVAAAGAVGGSIISSQASKKAGDQAAQSQRQAALLQQDMYNTTRDDLSRFRGLGDDNLYSNFYKTSADQLGKAYSDAYDHIPRPMTEEELLKTPGYAFQKREGLRAVANSNAAKGLGVSGEALKGSASYVTGLANKNYLDQFNMQQKVYEDYLQQAGLKNNQLTSIYGQIGEPMKMAQNSAAQTGYIGAEAGKNIGNSVGQVGNALAAGTTGSANALAGGLQNATGYLAGGVQNALDRSGSLRGGSNNSVPPWAAPAGYGGQYPTYSLDPNQGIY